MNKVYFLFFIVLVASCDSDKSLKNEYSRMVGDIAADPTVDNPSFTLCHGDSNALQYFNVRMGMQYKGEKAALLKEIHEHYDSSLESNENGLIRIRFIVNCKGETGRFRTIGMDTNYVEKQFDPKMVNQLMNITKNLKGWKKIPDEENARDYYQYLIFKFENGQLTEVLP